ncbi:transcriptional regulator [Clostridium haemolyticum]|uniref:transcriptional regulator n=1 Tax=Clostridium haemolyticum TaxID=84025 RepID=UPI00177CF2B8|nr:transcriptional regulator [Clostridium haemolyticum]
MATIRINKNKDYVVLNNTALNDEHLSFKAKGIFAYLMSKPDNWKCQITDLKNHAKDGTDSIRAGLRELREHGYMIKRPIKNEKNIIVAWEEILFEVPQTEAKEIFASQEVKRINSLEKRRTKSTKGKSVYGKNNNNSTSGFSTNGKPGFIISTNILNTNTSSSSSSIQSSSLIQNFNDEICELRKTTSIKFLEYTNTYTADFIKAIIEYCSETGIKSFAGFKTVIDSYIEKNILTREDLLKDIEKFRKEKTRKKFKRTIANNNKKVDSFNNYKQRNYDFEKLEKLLHGDTNIVLQDCIKEENSLIDNPALQDLKNLVSVSF